MTKKIKITAKDIIVPAGVPKDKRKTYIANYLAVTKNTGRFFLFACDQKIEHLHKDFYGTNIHPEANNPEHIFKIAQKGEIGALAAHLGLIARYAQQYDNINYIVKLNGKTPLSAYPGPQARQATPGAAPDPISRQLWKVDDVAFMAHNAQLPIAGVGYTIYLGSEHESLMLQQAAQIIYNAHQQGLLAILWIYPRGKAIKNDTDGMLLAGVCGVATSLGADVVKIKPPQADAALSSAQWLQIANQAAGNTKVICAGGPVINVKDFLAQLYTQLHIGSTAGCATGRNIFQHSQKEAIALTRAIAALIYDNSEVAQAIKLFRG